MLTLSTSKPELTIRYQTRLLTLNEYIDIERANKQKAAADKKRLTNNIKILTLSATRKKLYGCFDLLIIWTRKTKRHDPDNVYFGSKFILDGVVKAGTITGDGRKNIRHIYNQIQDGEKDSVEVQFHPIKNL